MEYKINNKNLIKCELKKISSIPIIRYLFLLVIFIQFFTFKSATAHYISMDMAGDHISTKLLTILICNLTILCPFFTIILSAYIVGIEFESNSWSINLTSISLKEFIKAKLLTIFISCIFIVICTVFIGLFLLYIDEYSISNIDFLKIFIQSIVTIFIQILLSIMVFTFSFILESSLSGILLGLFITILEPMLYNNIGLVKLILPFWNIRGFLEIYFSNLEIGDYLIIYPDNYISTIYSLITLLVIVSIFIIIFLKKIERKEF